MHLDAYEDYQDRKMRRGMGPEANWVYFFTAIVLILILHWAGLIGQ